MRAPILFLASFVLAYSCNPLPAIVEGESLLVVEGNIEDGHFPIVALSASIPVDYKLRSIDSLSQYVLLWSRVSINDGEDEVVLTGMYDDSRYPPYVYTTSRMQGEAGKTYTINVSGRGMKASASAKMPASCYLEDIWAEKIKDSDKYIIKAILPEEGYEYASFYVMREGIDDNYLHSYLSSVDRTNISESREVIILPGKSIFSDNQTYYERGLTVKVKFVTMDEDAYFFWTKFDEDETFTNSPFSPKMNNLPTNVKGGRGYWNAYGVKEYQVIIP